MHFYWNNWYEAWGWFMWFIISFSIFVGIAAIAKAVQSKKLSHQK